MELRIKPSDDLFEQINELSILISARKNRHLFSEFKDIPEVENNAEISALESKFRDITKEYYS